MTAAAPPSASTLEKMQKQGFDVTHVYGLTETYGPAVICSWDPEWSNHSLHDQAVLRARQGVQYHALEDLQASFIHMYACGSVWEYFKFHSHVRVRVCLGVLQVSCTCTRAGLFGSTSTLMNLCTK